MKNLAKRSERTYLTPPPQVTSLGELGTKLLADCQRDLDLPGPKPYQDQTRWQLLKDPSPRLSPKTVRGVGPPPGDIGRPVKIAFKPDQELPGAAWGRQGLAR